MLNGKVVTSDCNAGIKCSIKIVIAGSRFLDKAYKWVVIFVSLLDLFQACASFLWRVCPNCRE